MIRRSLGLWALGLLAATLLVACPALQGPKLQGQGAASSWQGPLKTRVVRTEVVDRYDSYPQWMRMLAEIEVTDATGAMVKGIQQEFFRLVLAPLPEDSKGALPAPNGTTGTLVGGGVGTAIDQPVAYPSVSPGGIGTYRIQVGPADMQRLPSVAGEIYSFEEGEPGRYFIRATFRLTTSGSTYNGSYPLPGTWVPSIAAFVSDDAEAGKIDHFFPQGSTAGDVSVGLGGTLGRKPYNTPMPMPMRSPGPGEIKGPLEAYPYPAPTFGGFPQGAKLTGRFFTYGGPQPAIGYQTLDGTRSTVVALPDYAGYFYFSSVQPGQYQVVYDGELQSRFGYLPYRPSPAPDVPIPTPSPSPSAGQSSGGVVGGIGYGYPVPISPPAAPKLLVSDPVAVPATSLAAPQVELDFTSVPAINNMTLIQTNADRFANFAVAGSFFGSGPSYYGTPRPAPKLEYQAQILDASGDILVTTASSSTSPLFWNLRDASGSVLPAGKYQVQLKFWAAGGRYGGPNFYGIGLPQQLNL